ncbi:MAG: 30S ribosomal protein S20 [Deltaproteobacteria bacterium]|nr:30S ribosomal protein S20 [Deltaproteobacteria bacterium]
MADHVSALKRNRQSLKRQARNRQVRARIRTFVRKAREAIEGTDVAVATTAARTAESELARAARKGVLHRKTAARRASRLAKQAAAKASPKS